MNTTLSRGSSGRMRSGILSIMVILAIVFQVTGSVSAQDPSPRIVASTAGDWLWTADFASGTLDITIFPSADSGAVPLWSGEATADASGFAFVGYDQHGVDLKPGHALLVSDGVTDKTLVLELITMEVFDPENNIMAGTAPLGRDVGAHAGPQEWQHRIMVQADPVSGAWRADFDAAGFDIVDEMRPWSYAHIYDADGDANEAGTPPPLPSTWRDDFDAPELSPGWFWQNGEPGAWSLTEAPGFLRLRLPNVGTGDGDFLLRQVQQGDFAIETHLIFEPDTNYQFAGLAIYQDSDNFLALGRAFCDNPGTCAGNGIYFDHVAGGEWTGENFARAVGTPGEAYLRLERRGEMVKAFFSYEGITWLEIGTHWVPVDFQANGVGLVAGGDFVEPSDPNTFADFDYFELTEGWGFLPEGFHDYHDGDVPRWGCGAGGWAADPDDRAVDLAIKIAVDGDALPDWLYAGEYRPDLEEGGACDGGNCAFSTHLWNVVSSYEPHSVVAYAQDVPSGDWVQLTNSPMTLTCRTYDIYSFDPQIGETRQITDKRDVDEFAPDWSANGRLVAYQVYQEDSPGEIHVTDLRTGLSWPLAGAEAGIAPAWSPNGRWIAFERGGDLYVVSSGGGEAALVRSDAATPDWSSNGRRLVFQQPSDGSIRTVAVDGSGAAPGPETLVAPRGTSPAWSPNGQWIVYAHAGDIWKMAVSLFGAPQGEPVRVTGGAFQDGQPAWSADGSTIVYHSGFGGDWDLWTVPAKGGESAWLTGARNWDDYDPAYARNGSIAYASFSPDGQAAREWVAAYTYDSPPGSFGEGTHPYHFDFEWSRPEPGAWSGQGGEFVVSSEADLHPGYVLLRGPAELRGINGPGGLVCEPVDQVNPAQPTRFLIGWALEAGAAPYPEARAQFDSILATAVWDGGSAPLVRHEIIPFRPDEWAGYACTFSEAPPKMDLRVNYGPGDWVESFYEAGHEVQITVQDAEGNVKATATSVTEPKDFWDGATGFQTRADEWIPAPPDLQPYDWVYAAVDNGVTAQVQLGDISGEVSIDLDGVTGTILAPWLSDPVPVECLDWGSGAEQPFPNKSGGFVTPNGSDSYSCTWAGEWDVQPWQDIGVAYATPDGHWVANAFHDEG